MSTKSITPAALLGATLVGGLTAVNVASAADNPFALRALDSGYMQLAEGGSDKGTGEGKCGSKTDEEGKCGSKSGGEGKCGEGKCGSKM